MIDTGLAIPEVEMLHSVWFGEQPSDVPKRSTFLTAMKTRGDMIPFRQALEAFTAKEMK